MMSGAIDNIVAQYKYLCSAGYEASLTLCSDKGQTRAKLDVNLGFSLPPCSTPPPVSSSPRKRSPSYYRRLKKRSEARKHFNSSYENDDKSQVVASVEDAEPMVAVVAEKVSNESISNLDVCPGNSAVNSNITSTNTMHDNVAEVSVHSEVEDVTTTICDDVVSRSNISMVCEAEVLPTKMVENVAAPINSQVDGTRTEIAPTLMPIYAQGQTMPNDAARYMSSNGYPLPRLTLM